MPNPRTQRPPRLPGARWVPGVDAGPFVVQHRCAVWHTTEGKAGSSAGAVRTYERHRVWPHVTWDPSNGELLQHVEADRAARALANDPGGVETNRAGALQIEIVGRAAAPFTAGPMLGRLVLVEWLRELGVPDVWPAGDPLAYGRGGWPAYGVKNGDRGSWGQAGHYGHSQVPENAHGDPGAIDIGLLLQREGTDVARELIRATKTASVFEVVGSHLELVTAQAFAARGLTQSDVRVLPADHALLQLPRG